MEELSHAVMIRLHYQPGDADFEWRLAFFRSMVFPRLLHQTDQNFEIWVWCHPEHSQRIAEVSGRIRIWETVQFSRVSKRGVLDPKELLNVKGEELPRFDIQSRLDSDDFISSEYIAKVKKEVSRFVGKASVIISFQPYKLCLWKLTRYKMRTRYHASQCSMFFSLYQPRSAVYHNVWGVSHIRAYQIVNNVVTVSEGYCDLVVHGINVQTDIAKTDVAL